MHFAGVGVCWPSPSPRGQLRSGVVAPLSSSPKQGAASPAAGQLPSPLPCISDQLLPAKPGHEAREVLPSPFPPRRGGREDGDRKTPPPPRRPGLLRPQGVGVPMEAPQDPRKAGRGPGGAASAPLASPARPAGAVRRRAEAPRCGGT